MGIWNAFVGLLSSIWVWIWPALLLLMGVGCIASGSTKGGQVDVNWYPAIGWRVDTSLYFNDGKLPLFSLTGARVEGEAETEPVADIPEP